jgi:hypothetical protein
MEMGGVARKIVEEFFPVKLGENVAVTAALQAADTWIEFNDSRLLYSNAWKKPMKAGIRRFTL